MRSLSEGLTSAQVEESEKNESCDRVKTSFQTWTEKARSNPSRSVRWALRLAAVAMTRNPTPPIRSWLENLKYFVKLFEHLHGTLKGCGIGLWAAILLAVSLDLYYT